MRIDELMKNIVSSSTYQKEIGTSCQLGLPIFTMRNNELFVTFYPHTEKFSNGAVSYFAPQYELELIYPFRHIVLLRNLFFTRNEPGISFDEPVYNCSLNDFEANVDCLHKLFSMADEILYSRENVSKELTVLVSEYKKSYTHFIESTGLQAIYGRCL